MRVHVIKTAIFLMVCVQSITKTIGERTSAKMYEHISGASCFRRLNGTHQTGCSSKETGSVGVLYRIEKEADIEFLGSGAPLTAYAVLIPPRLFTRKIMLRLKQEFGSIVTVVLLVNRIEDLKQFSHELNCPNQHSGIVRYNTTESATCNSGTPANSWNPSGTGLLHEDFPFPIFYVAESEEISKLDNCFQKFNNFDYEKQTTRSLCAVEVKSFMSAAVSSEVCMRRTNFINNFGGTKYCDPLEGRNVYATLFPRELFEPNEKYPNKPLNDEKFILITCRLDTTSMFDGVGLGAMDSLLGFATLINIAHMLHVLLPHETDIPDKRNILFVVFNGESYDYIGSQRFVYDLQRLAFPSQSTHSYPISLKNIEFMLDIGTLDDISTVKLHTLDATVEAQNFLKMLNKYSNDLKFQFNINFQATVGYQIPPTSAQSFLRLNKSFPAFILNAPPSNKFYHSIYDDLENVKFIYGNTSFDFTNLIDIGESVKLFPFDSIQLKIRNISSVVGLALYELLTGNTYTKTLVANPVLTDEFLYCFLQSSDCPLFKAASHPNSLQGLPIPPMRYISVSGASQESSGWTYRILGYLLSRHLPNISQENCTNLPLYWFSGYDKNGECRLTTNNFSHALSPAFSIEDYIWNSGEYSTWTESTWSQFSARIFLRPSNVHEIITLSTGLVLFVISFCLVYIVNSRSDILFVDAPTSTAALFS